MPENQTGQNKPEGEGENGKQQDGITCGQVKEGGGDEQGPEESDLCWQNISIEVLSCWRFGLLKNFFSDPDTND